MKFKAANSTDITLRYLLVDPRNRIQHGIGLIVYRSSILKEYDSIFVQAPPIGLFVRSKLLLLTLFMCM